MAHHAVSGLDVRNTLTHLLNGGGGFVAEQVGKVLVRPLRALDLIELGAADASAMDFHKHLPEA